MLYRTFRKKAATLASNAPASDVGSGAQGSTINVRDSIR